MTTTQLTCEQVDGKWIVEFIAPSNLFNLSYTSQTSASVVLEMQVGDTEDYYGQCLLQIPGNVNVFSKNISNAVTGQNLRLVSDVHLDNCSVSYE